MLGSSPVPDALEFETEAPTLKEGLIESLEDYIQQHPDLGLLVIDTLKKIRDTPRGKESAYGIDYKEVGVLKAFADRHNICLLVLHHNRKQADDTDPFNQINGTTSIMAAADTIFVMTRKHRSDSQTKLSITGRDINSENLILSFDPNSCFWHSMGNEDQLTQQKKRQSYEIDSVVITIRKLLCEKPAGWSGTMSQLMEEGKQLTGTQLADNSRQLSAKLNSLDPLLLTYDEILHTKKSKGSGGAVHTIRYKATNHKNDLLIVE